MEGMLFSEMQPKMQNQSKKLKAKELEAGNLKNKLKLVLAKCKNYDKQKIQILHIINTQLIRHFQKIIMSIILSSKNNYLTFDINSSILLYNYNNSIKNFSKWLDKVVIFVVNKGILPESVGREVSVLVDVGNESKCFTCGGVGHFSRECPTKYKNTRTGGGDSKCFNCQKYGHLARECRQGQHGTLCYSCNDKGHIARDCPKGDRKKEMQCHNCHETGHFARECPCK